MNRTFHMTLDVAEEPMTAVVDYAMVPITFSVDRVLEVSPRLDSGFDLSTRRLEVPYVKDYDALDGEGPLHWAGRFNVTSWTLFVARSAGLRVGGATVAINAGELVRTEEHSDVCLLWDIRVAPNSRGHGIGSALFRRVETWAKAHGCRQLEAETQSTNVRACEFYARHGCQLRSAHRAVYPQFPEEIQLLWSKDLRIASEKQ
jgi:GNAT superfamily N-acetyltransferase